MLLDSIGERSLQQPSVSASLVGRVKLRLWCETAKPALGVTAAPKPPLLHEPGTEMWLLQETCLGRHAKAGEQT